MMAFNVSRAEASPFPHFECVDVFKPGWYSVLLDTWPNESTFRILDGPYKKLSLSQRCNPEAYVAFLKRDDNWRSFFKWVTRGGLIAALADAGISILTSDTARFEFSSLPSDGGAIAPHRDIPSKVLTIVVPMTWEAVPGWGTDILEPLGPVGADYQTPRDAFRTAHSFTYAPNTCGIFLKTEDSWHAIGPLKGPAGAWRRTLTINIERGDRGR